MINVLGANSSTAAMKQVTPAMMELNNYYIIEVTGFDDVSGEETSALDIVYFTMDRPPGQAKDIKTIKFCQAPKWVTFSQMPGAKYYGPLKLHDDTAATGTIVENEGLSSIMAAAAKRSAKL